MNSQPQKLKLYINIEVSRFIHDSKKSLKTHLISNSTYNVTFINATCLYSYMYMHKWDLSLTKINIFHIHSISTNQVQNILDHTYTFLYMYIYINVNTGKQIEVNTFNLFFFFNSCFMQSLWSSWQKFIIGDHSYIQFQAKLDKTNA